MSLLKNIIQDDTIKYDDNPEMQMTKISSKDYPQMEKTFKKFYSSTKKSKTYKIYTKKLNNKSCWQMSATTNTRDVSPSFTVPKSPRFSSIQKDIQKNGKFLSLQLREELTRGISFTNSKRKNHWLKDNAHFPSSSTYFLNSQNSKPQYSLQYKTLNLRSQKYASMDRPNTGITISRCTKPEKQYLYHGRKKLHDPELVKANPGVAKYFINNDENNSCSYTMGKLTKRFNQEDHDYPSPNSYIIEEKKPHKSKSINIKGTFHKSKRTFLVNPDNETPGPGQYLK